MPSGNVHSGATIGLSIVAGLVGHYNGIPDLPQGAALTGGILAGLLLTPDLDVNNGSISNEHARKIFGGPVGLLWMILWKPYSWLIPHRSPLSHLPVLGTVIRLGYLVGVIWLILYLFHFTGAFHMPALPGWWSWAFVGLVASDTLHFVMDKTLRN